MIPLTRAKIWTSCAAARNVTGAESVSAWARATGAASAGEGGGGAASEAVFEPTSASAPPLGGVGTPPPPPADGKGRPANPTDPHAAGFFKRSPPAKGRGSAPRAATRTG